VWAIIITKFLSRYYHEWGVQLRPECHIDKFSSGKQAEGYLKQQGEGEKQLDTGEKTITIQTICLAMEKTA